MIHDSIGVPAKAVMPGETMQQIEMADFVPEMNARVEQQIKQLSFQEVLSRLKEQEFWAFRCGPVK
jgi:hypothetical protein